MSAGGPVSMQLALRHPERVSALVLLSTAAYAPSAPTDRKLPVPDVIYKTLFGSDFLFWMMVWRASPALAASFDVTPDLRASLAPDEKAHLEAMTEDMLPIRTRSVGLVNDAALAIFLVLLLGDPPLWLGIIGLLGIIGAVIWTERTAPARVGARV